MGCRWEVTCAVRVRNGNGVVFGVRTGSVLEMDGAVDGAGMGQEAEMGMQLGLGFGPGWKMAVGGGELSTG